MATPRGRVLCVGSIVLDILVRPVEALPPWGATLWVDSIDRHLGGNGAIAACALGILGTPVTLAGAVGGDDFGRYLLARLQSAGVDTSQVQVHNGVPTATTVGLVNGSSERLFLHVKGASDAADPDRIHFESFTHLHFGSIFQMARLRESACRLLVRARRAGLLTSVDTAWDSLGRWMDDFAPLCPLLDCLFVNRQEAHMLTGLEDPAQAARSFHERGVPVVVLKLGEQGCAVSTPESYIEVPGFRVPPVDTTGAGDVFCGGFLAARLRGASVVEAARFANGVAAHCVQRIGGTEGLVDYEKTLAWVRSRA